MTTTFCHRCRRAVHVGGEDARVCPACASPLTTAAMPYEPDVAADRIAKNEVIFREVNERIRHAADEPSGGGIGFVCECGQQSCNAPVEMSVSEYEQVRKAPTWFLTLPGHEIPGVEVVIEERQGYQVVEKVGAPRRIAEGSSGR